MRATAPRTAWADVRRNLPLPRRCGGPAPIARPRVTDRRPINPSAHVDPLDGGCRPDGTQLSRWDRIALAVIASAVLPRAGKSRTPRMSLRWARLRAGRAGGCSMDSRGAAGLTRGRSSSRGETGEDTTSMVPQTVLILMPGSSSDAAPFFLPRAHGVASLRAVVAPASRNRPPDRPCTHGSSAPLIAAFSSWHAEGVAFRWGSKWGSPGEHRAVGFGHEPSL